MTPTLLNALSQNGAAIPSAPTRMPPSAGPTARLTLMPTLFAATAADRSDLGHELRHHRLPGGRRNRRTHGHNEAEQQ